MNHCDTCQHTLEKTSFPNCAKCLKEGKPGDRFPGWEPKGAKQ